MNAISYFIIKDELKWHDWSNQQDKLRMKIDFENRENHCQGPAKDIQVHKNDEAKDQTIRKSFQDDQGCLPGGWKLARAVVCLLSHKGG